MPQFSLPVSSHKQNVAEESRWPRIRSTSRRTCSLSLGSASTRELPRSSLRKRERTVLAESKEEATERPCVRRRPTMAPSSFRRSAVPVFFAAAGPTPRSPSGGQYARLVRVVKIGRSFVRIHPYRRHVSQVFAQVRFYPVGSVIAAPCPRPGRAGARRPSYDVRPCLAPPTPLLLLPPSPSHGEDRTQPASLSISFFRLPPGSNPRAAWLPFDLRAEGGRLAGQNVCTPSATDSRGTDSNRTFLFRRHVSVHLQPAQAQELQQPRPPPTVAPSSISATGLCGGKQGWRLRRHDRKQRQRTHPSLLPWQ